MTYLPAPTGILGNIGEAMDQVAANVCAGTGIAVVFGLTLLLLVRIGMEERFERRRSAGLCTNCGYDLRASRTTCPECGPQVPANACEKGAEEGGAISGNSVPWMLIAVVITVGICLCGAVVLYVLLNRW